MTKHSTQDFEETPNIKNVLTIEEEAGSLNDKLKEGNERTNSLIIIGHPIYSVKMSQLCCKTSKANTNDV